MEKTRMGLSNVLREGISKWGTPSALLFHIRQHSSMFSPHDNLKDKLILLQACYYSHCIHVCVAWICLPSPLLLLLYYFLSLRASLPLDFWEVGLYHKLTLGPLAASVHIWPHAPPLLHVYCLSLWNMTRMIKLEAPSSRGPQVCSVGPISSFVCNDLQI